MSLHSMNLETKSSHFVLSSQISGKKSILTSLELSLRLTTGLSDSKATNSLDFGVHLQLLISEGGHLSHNKHVSFGIVLVLLGMWLAMPLRPAFGQAVVSSDILGQITDASGAVIPDATVTVANQSTGFTRTVHSDSSGAYLCNGIVSGLYTVSVEKAGFKKYVRTDLDLTASRKMRIDVTLELGQMTQTVTVKGETPLIETETAAVSSEERNYGHQRTS